MRRRIYLGRRARASCIMLCVYRFDKPCRLMSKIWSAYSSILKGFTHVRPLQIGAHHNSTLGASLLLHMESFLLTGELHSAARRYVPAFIFFGRSYVAVHCHSFALPSFWLRSFKFLIPPILGYSNLIRYKDTAELSPHLLHFSTGREAVHPQLPSIGGALVGLSQRVENGTCQ